jgi:hypothetical protein
MGIVILRFRDWPLLFLLPGRCCAGVKLNSMLHQVSWPQFLVAALGLSLVWYAALFLFFFRGRKGCRVSGKKRLDFLSAALLPQDREQAAGDLPEADLVGRPRWPEGMSRIGSHELLFGGSETGEALDKGTQLGVIPDLLRELQDIFRALETEQGSKQDFFEWFGLVRARFPGLNGTPAIHAYIREHVLFPLSDAELDALWD